MKKIIILINLLLLCVILFCACGKSTEVTIGDNGNWFLDGIDSGVSAAGKNGNNAIAPQIRINPESNEWEVSTDNGLTWQSTGVLATGLKGNDGNDAIAPQIRINLETNKWEISTDAGLTWQSTGVLATGLKGDDGSDAIAPQIRINSVTNMWEVSTDAGLTWQSTGVLATAETSSVDKKDTKITLTVTDEYLLDISGIYNLDNQGDVTHIDWGDGYKNDIWGVSDEEFKHTYVTGGSYTITLTGLTKIPAVQAFRKKAVTALEIGSIVTEISYLAFNPCNLTKITIHASTPPTLTGVVDSSFLPFDLSQISEISVPAKSILAYAQADIWKDYYAGILCGADQEMTGIYGNKTVTVGEKGTFSTINEALAYLSTYYPLYKSNGITCEIQILEGTVINEQIKVEQIDLSYISITSAAADNTVKVDVTNWTGITHDTRGNKPFISGEDGARLPRIACLFSCIVPEEGWVTSGDSKEINMAVGYFCNRGSTGVIAGSIDANGIRANVGFENFYDNIIANNNSEIVAREAIIRNAARYGVLSRHISRISARSADVTNCGEIAAYADRASMIDIRCADLSGSKNAIAAYHASTITANQAQANNITEMLANSQYASTLNCQGIICNTAKNAFHVIGGATIVTADSVIGNITGEKYSQEINTLTEHGIIYASLP